MANQQQQEIDVTTSIEVRVSSEYGILRTVVMRLAAPFTLDLDHSEHFNRSFQRQLEHNRWQSYDHRVVRDQQQVFIETM